MKITTYETVNLFNNVIFLYLGIINIWGISFSLEARVTPSMQIKFGIASYPEFKKKFLMLNLNFISCYFFLSLENIYTYYDSRKEHGDLQISRFLKVAKSFIYKSRNDLEFIDRKF